MALDIKYRVVEKYAVIAELTQPMHIGSANGGMGEILVHPVDDVPFIQASGIAGVFRNYCSKYCSEATAEKFFGSIRNADAKGGEGDSREEAAPENDASAAVGNETSGTGSRLRISDGYFLSKKGEVGLELRPRIEINPETGSVAASKIKGSGEKGGHKFEMEYIGEGAQCTFTIYDMSPDDTLYNDEEKIKKESESSEAADAKAEGKSEGRLLMEKIFAAVNAEDIQFGGQKSNGCGYMRIKSVKFIRFDLSDPEQMRKWIHEEDVPETDMQNLEINESAPVAAAYRITVAGKTENRVLVKAIAVENRDGSAPDARNITNNAGKYIIPASSFKGAVRSRFEKIIKYLGNDAAIDVSGVLYDSFGSDICRKEKGQKNPETDERADETGTQSGKTDKSAYDKAMKLGNLRFFDTVIYDVWDKRGGETVCEKNQNHESGGHGSDISEGSENGRAGEKAAGKNHLAKRSSLAHKIHIDKFTGGVFNKALVTERTIGGEISFKMNILDMNNPNKTCAVMLMVLRDLANGQFNLGSGYASGKGFIDVRTIMVESGQDNKAVLDFENGRIEDGKGMIRKCMDALRKEGN